MVGVVGFLVINNGICYFLNGNSIEFKSNEKYADGAAHKNEQWVYLNGVAAG